MNPFVGVIFHWLGGLASASFYIPYRGVKRWSWETYWLAGGVFSWIIAPWALALLLVPGALAAILSVDKSVILNAYLCGVGWGLGGLTFGLTMRYLGIALGMAVALGFCAAFGTLVPPIFHGEMGNLLAHAPGQITLLGVLVCLAGIGVSGMAGMSKERELSDEQKKAAIAEFDFGKGMLVATFSGVMSSFFAFGLDAGKPIGEAAKAQLLAHGGSVLWQNLPVLIVVLAGGFTTNFIWCVILNVKNRSAHEYLNLRRSAVTEVSATEGVMPYDADQLAGSSAVDSAAASHGGPAGPTRFSEPAPLLNNYLFSALAGVTWYMQFFFYSMGETKMGNYSFASWTLHMASIIIFSTLWGIALKEWSGVGGRTRQLVGLGLATLIGSTVIVGYGTLLNQKKEKATTGAEKTAQVQSAQAVATTR